ncbi:hypothetical protein MNBD_BACTEROID02-1241, partial [hydrothermal vent metagenome]
MTEKKDNYEKVLFKYYSNVLDEITIETMWAKIIDKNKGIYRLDSIPFYGPLIATDDEFFAEFDETEQMITYRKTTNHSGNSIVLVSIIQKEINKEIIRDEFKSMNCTSEGLNESYFSMEILASTNYSIIKAKLSKYEKDGILDYAEPCLSEKHRNDIK